MFGENEMWCHQHNLDNEILSSYRLCVLWNRCMDSRTLTSNGALNI